MSKASQATFRAPTQFFTTDESAQYFESGYSCDNAILLRLDSRKVFFTDSRYTTEAREHLRADVELVESSNLLESLIDTLQKERVKTLALDSSAVCVRDYALLQERLSHCAFELLPNFHQQMRIIKSAQEIELIATSQAINKQAYTTLAQAINTMYSGAKTIKEYELHALTRNILESNGKYDLSFNPIVSLNANAAKPHALPCEEELRNGDLLLVDAGVKYRRYCSDRTRTAIFTDGGIDFEARQHFTDSKLQTIYDIVAKAQEYAITHARTGMSGKEIDALARGIIDKAGFGEYFSHSTGHGIGLDIHELPSISKRSETIIEDGMVFSIEPGIYLPGLYGVRIEDLVVMENGKARVL